MKTIPLTQNKCALIDDEDFKKVNAHKWYALKSGHYWYACSYDSKNKKTIYMHRLILNTPTGTDTDHINHNGLDNRKKNLRTCTKAQNQHNTMLCKRRKKSKYKGLYWNKKGGKWVARINRTYIGSYSDEKEAALAYDKAAKELYGEFACTNF